MFLFKNVYINTSFLILLLSALLICGAGLFFWKSGFTFKATDLSPVSSIPPITNMRKIFYICGIFTIYLLIDAFITVYSEKIPLAVIFKSYYLYYIYFIILPLFFFVEKSLNDKIISLSIVFLLIPLSILGIFQYAKNSPLVYSGPSGRIFGGELSSPLATYFFGKLRIFSLFNYSMGLAYMLSMGIAICLFVLFIFFKSKFKSVGEDEGKYRGKEGAFSLFIASISAIAIALFLTAGYMTLVRDAYLEIFTDVLFCIIVLTVTSNVKTLKITALIIPFVITFIIYIFAEYYRGSGHINIFNSGSLYMRLKEWVHYSEKFIGAGPLQILFGVGATEERGIGPFNGWGNFLGLKEFTIDNGYLAILIQTGIVGFILWFSYLWLIFDYVLNEFAKKKTAVTLMAAALIFSLFTTNIFDNTFLRSIFVVYLLILSGKNSAENVIIK